MERVLIILAYIPICFKARHNTKISQQVCIEQDYRSYTYLAQHFCQIFMRLQLLFNLIICFLQCRALGLQDYKAWQRHNWNIYQAHIWRNEQLYYVINKEQHGTMYVLLIIVILTNIFLVIIFMLVVSIFHNKYCSVVLKHFYV